MAATQTATYKGRTYRLLWQGSTRYGRRAKLGFMDGTKQFWVDESRISAGGSRGGGRSKRREPCAECGDYNGTVECQDSSGLTGLCCRMCAGQPWYTRSFA